MRHPSAHTDWWRLFGLLPWFVFFFIGLVPETVYLFLREAGRVPTQRALINSPLAISFALAAYFAFFVYRRCAECDADKGRAPWRAIYFGVVALSAFIGLPYGGSAMQSGTLLGSLIAYRTVGDPSVRVALLIAGVTKIALWWCLFVVILRYHLAGDARIFALKGTSGEAEKSAVAGTAPCED